MSDTLHLSFGALPAAELELAQSIAKSENRRDPESESFGLDFAVAAPGSFRVWGLWIRGALAGAVWVLPVPGSGSAEVRALALARGWRRLGLATWMLVRLGALLEAEGIGELRVTLTGGGTAVGRELDAAGFRGPGAETPAYPVGEWLLRTSRGNLLAPD